MSSKEEFEKALAKMESPAQFDSIFELTDAIRAHLAEKVQEIYSLNRWIDGARLDIEGLSSQVAEKDRECGDKNDTIALLEAHNEEWADRYTELEAANERYRGVIRILEADADRLELELRLYRSTHRQSCWMNYLTSIKKLFR